jgi:polyisoprenoid-binding protein YceI
MPWEYDPRHSLVEVRAKHMGIALLQGVFTRLKVEATIDENDVTKSTFAATIDAASLDVRYDRANQMFASEAHLDAERYPEITFKSTKIEPRGDKYAVIGDVSLHGVTRVVTWDGTYNGEATDYFGNKVRGYSLTTVIKLSDFNVHGGDGTDDVRVNLEVEMTKKVEGQEPARRGGGRPEGAGGGGGRPEGAGGGGRPEGAGGGRPGGGH